MKIVSWIEKYIVMIILLWDIDLKDNLIVKLFVFFIFYYFDEIIFKYWKNKCIWITWYIFGQNDTSIYNVMGYDFCLKILSVFTLYMCVDMLLSFVWLDIIWWWWWRLIYDINIWNIMYHACWCIVWWINLFYMIICILYFLATWLWTFLCMFYII
jgi:hypothetical protein